MLNFIKCFKRVLIKIISELIPDSVLVILGEEFRHFGMFHLEDKHGLCAGFVIFKIDLNVNLKVRQNIF
jgi:hypothetical protein